MKAVAFLSQKEEAIQLIKNSIENNFIQLPLDVLNWQPTPEKWSIAQCFEHLNIYCDYYLKAMKDLINKNSIVVKDVNYAYQSSWLGRKSIESVYPSNSKKMKTMKRFNPTLLKVRKNGLQVFLAYQNQFLELLEQANHININKIKVPIEFFKLLKLRMGDCIEFMVAHQQRHLQQALNILTLYKKEETVDKV